MKTILVHIEDDDGLEGRLQTSLDLCRSQGAHLKCLQVVPTFAQLSFNMFGSTMMMSDLLEQVETHADKLEAKMKERLANEDVTWDYKRTNQEALSAIIGGSMLADLVTLSHPVSDGDWSIENSIIGDLLMTTRTPLFVVPEKSSKFDPTGVALVAWNGSMESATALKAAVPLLAKASKVALVTVEEKKASTRRDYFPSTEASEYLSRYDISTELHAQPEGSASIGEALGLAANVANAGYIVMGAYGHSRAREYIFGGVTRTMLKHTKVPLFLTH